MKLSKITMVEALSKLPNYVIFHKLLSFNQKGMGELAKESEYRQKLHRMSIQIHKKKEDLGSLTIPCKFGSLKTYPLTDFGESLSLMLDSFLLKLGASKVESTKLASHMANKSVTHQNDFLGIFP